MRSFIIRFMTIVGVAAIVRAAGAPDSWPPRVTLPEALRLAEQFVLTNKIDTSEQYLSGIRLGTVSGGIHYWEVGWMHTNKMVKGGFFHVRVGMDKTLTLHPGK